jgi:hypothetical protein
LDIIEEAFEKTPPMPLDTEWKAGVSARRGRAAANLLDCFFDVDGEPLTRRLRGLADISVRTGKPIMFQ